MNFFLLIHLKSNPINRLILIENLWRLSPYETMIINSVVFISQQQAFKPDLWAFLWRFFSDSNKTFFINIFSVCVFLWKFLHIAKSKFLEPYHSLLQYFKSRKIYKWCKTSYWKIIQSKINKYREWFLYRERERKKKVRERELKPLQLKRNSLLNNFY